MYESISIEERNKPTVSLVNNGFLSDAESASRGKGMPYLRYVPTSVPCESSVISDIEEGIGEVVDDIIDALTRPLTLEEKSPEQRELKEQTRIIFKGNFEDVNRFFYKRGWSDGFPVVPPTEEAVAEMLTGTDLPPEHLLGELQSRGGKATVEKIAVNAVMAGCLPTHMPILIAATINLLESEAGFNGFTTYGFSTGSWAPFWIINGPVAEQININNGSGALSPGNIANAAIGRAIGLIIKNIGGVRKGVEDMGTIGNPMKYTLVISENEEESPWEPLHVELGHKKEDSTVTMSFPNCYLQHIPYTSDADGILRAIVDHMPRGMRYNIVITPAHARNLSREGYDKEKVKKYIMDNKLVTRERITAFLGMGPVQEDSNDRNGNESEMMPLIDDIRYIRIIVAGGPGAWIAHLAGGGATPGKKEIQKIELPENWDSLVAKYRNVAPRYAKY
ncbi:hypothetical protein ACFL1N_00340 [Thermodesulfobacteriota bacterium]